MLENLTNDKLHLLSTHYTNGNKMQEGAIYNERELDIEEVILHRKVTGSIMDYPGATMEFIDSAEGLEQACDVLVPAALENQITLDNIFNKQSQQYKIKYLYLQQKQSKTVHATL